MKSAIGIVPWNDNFIAALADIVAGRCEGFRPFGAASAANADAHIVFPHNRPARHLRAALAEHPDIPRPCLLPRMQTLDDFLRTLRQELSPDPLVRAGKLDRIGLLARVVRELALEGGPLAALNGTPRDFFPWGARLSSLLDEMAGQAVPPAALHNLSGEVLPWAEALLGQLDTVAVRYRQALDERAWTTPGLDSLWLCNHAEDAADHLAGRAVVFAGLHALSGAEEPLLRTLWERGVARFVWHTDPALTEGRAPAWPAREHGRWLVRWGARAELARVSGKAAPSETPQVRRFYEGFDLHSQLSVLERELASLPETASTAVVLPDPGALIPVMHHLPDADVNISMGYPLNRSSLAQLVETILTLHENADAGGRFAWRDMIALVRHPLLRMLRPVDELDEMPLKSAYVAWERHIRSSGAMQRPEQWAFVYDVDAFSPPEEDVRALHEEVVQACFHNFQGLATLRQAGQALEALCRLLRERAGDAWRRHLIDAECMLRLWQSVVPELTGSILADEPYDQGLVFLILRHLLDAERVSFEPEPLAGMQVLGMLETRLLSFDRLFILDATEDKLPGANPPDPLLPDSLRQALGLPGRRERDNVAAHNFFRLLMGARHVTLLYQAGVRPGALEGKSERSRYVEQLLWDLEQRTGTLVKPVSMDVEDAPLRTVSFPPGPIVPRQPAIAVTPALRARMAQVFAEKGMTPSRFAVWMDCPKKAFYAQVLGLRAMREVAEDGDHARLGELVHRVLGEFLAPHLDKPVSGERLDALALANGFERALEEDAFSLELPYDARAVLLATGRERLLRFVANIPQTTVVAVEHPALTRLVVGGMEETRADGSGIALQGRIDRVDRRNGKHLVLDYKTGGFKDTGGAPWLDSELFDRLAAAAPGTAEAALVLADLAAAQIEVQLPLYLHMLAADKAFSPGNAAWVELRADGAEKPLFSAKVSEEERARVIHERVPALARFVLEHMLAASELPSRPGRQCTWCDFRGPCTA